MLPLNVESFWNIRQERPIERQGAWATPGYYAIRTHTMTAGGIFSLLTTM